MNKLFGVAESSGFLSARIVTLLALIAVALGFAFAADRTQIVINDTRAFPESFTSSANGTVFFGSAGKNMVYRAAPGSGTAEAWIQPGTAELKRVLGVFADDRDKTLWVCSVKLNGGDPSAQGETSLKAFDLSTGAFKASYTYPGGVGVCNDVAVARDRTIYATETAAGHVLRLKRGASALEVWSSDPLLASADGIALLADGSVYVNCIRTGFLVRIPVLPDGSAGQAVKIETSRPLVRPDGMRSAGRNTILLAEGEGRLDEVTVKGDKADVKVLKDGLTAPTAVTLIGHTAFVLEGKLSYMNDPKLKDQDPGPFLAVPVPYHAPK